MFYFTRHNILSNNLFGFIPGRSANMQLLNLLDKWTKHLDENNGTDIIYVDFEKAFDKALYNRLLFKLKQYGLNDYIWKWITNYLINRRYKVRLNKKYSNREKGTRGILHGYVLDLLLFLIYSNDLLKECENLSDILIFTGNAKLSRLLKYNNDKITLREALNKLKIWADKYY